MEIKRLLYGVYGAEPTPREPPQGRRSSTIGHCKTKSWRIAQPHLPIVAARELTALNPQDVQCLERFLHLLL